jgi:formylglycine-generating enzyme
MRRSIAAPAWVLSAFCLAAAAGPPGPMGRACASACRPHEIFVPAGRYTPFFKTGAETRVVPVVPLCLSATPVTHEEFQGFVRDHPDWRKSRIKALYAEETYLADWQDDLSPQKEMLSQPVTFVSWFAAGAYCEARGGRLPTVAEWERFAGDNTRANKPGAAGGAAGAGATPFAFAMGRSAPDLSNTALEFRGVWEWTANFNSALVSGRIGTNEGADSSQFCGDGIRAVDPSNYAAFLRYSFRSSLRASFALKNLGFRCVREAS